MTPTTATLPPPVARSGGAIRSPWPRMSYEEYLAYPDVPQASEWVDGEVQIMSIKKLQSELSMLLGTAMNWYVEAQGLGVVHMDPFNMKTGPDLPGRTPDVLFVASEHLDRITDANLAGPADLVIEVVSEESRKRDRVTKLVEYEAGGVPEYWWLDPEREEAGFYQLRDDGKYVRCYADAGGIYHSRVLPRVRLDVPSLWRRPLPKVHELVRAWETQ